MACELELSAILQSVEIFMIMYLRSRMVDRLMADRLVNFLRLRYFFSAKKKQNRKPIHP